MMFHVDARIQKGQDPAPEYDIEVKRVAELRAEGFIEQMFVRTDGSGGFLVVSADDADGVDAKLSTLPFYKSGVMKFTVDPIEIR